MANKYAKALIAILLVIILVFVTQLIVGIFGVASASVNSTIGSLTLTGSGLVSNSVPGNAVNDNSISGNALVFTCSGSCSWISAGTPLTVIVSGNIISTYATNTAYAVPGTSNTQTFTVTSSSSPQTLCTGCGNFYNMTVFATAGTDKNFGAYPSITMTVQQNYLGVAHNSVPSTFATNSISVTRVETITLGTPDLQFSQVGQSNSTIIPFITVIVIVSLVVILLNLFGLGDILNLKSSE